jgi:parallel beta-helix repeat protein
LSPIFIKADGSVDPSTDIINRSGSTYSLTKDISGSYYVSIYCSNIVFDGKGHTIDSGSVKTIFGIETSDVSNVIIKNVALQGFISGIGLFNTNHSIVTDVTICNGRGLWLQKSYFNQVTYNNIVNNSINGGISLYASNNNTVGSNSLSANEIAFLIINSQNNTLSGNIISNSGTAIELQYNIKDMNAWDTMPINNLLYQNNFIDNSQLINQTVVQGVQGENGSFINYWYYEGYGNYWSDYSVKYHNATEIASTGIGDTPYMLDANNTDYYPLVRPLEIKLPQTPTIANPMPTPIPSLTPNSPIPSSTPSPTSKPNLTPSSVPSSSQMPTPFPTLTSITTPTQVSSNYLLDQILRTAISIAIAVVVVASISLVYFRRRKGKLASKPN